jgi:hypothetical protein
MGALAIIEHFDVIEELAARLSARGEVATVSTWPTRICRRSHHCSKARRADDPSNMQWQTIAEGKAKNKWE